MAEPRTTRPGKQVLLRAAVEVMGEDGYEGASTRDMASRAGVSVSALYYHFPSKHDLLREFLEEAYDIALNRVRRRIDGLTDPVEQLREIVGTIIWSHLHDDFAQAASHVLVREYTRLDPPSRAAIEQRRDELLSLVELVIGEGVTSGAFGAIEPRETARAIITLATTLALPYAAIGRPLDDVIALYQDFAVTLACGSVAASASAPAPPPGRTRSG
jgi:AcrR family transcriptional regulator